MVKTNEKIELRAEEIRNLITAFEKEKYDKDNLLVELLKLQDELVNIIFNDEHAKSANLRIWNVCKQLETLNEEKGSLVELDSIISQCKYIGNLISALISGVSGERKAFFSLLNMNCKKTILQNIELSYEGITSELDDVVVTSKGIFLIEVKNTGRDISIDENGIFYRRENDGFSFDCNIGEKMNYKEQLLKNAVGELLKDKKIHSILVFTNGNIKVENSYRYVKHCFLGQLPHLIEEFEGEDIYSDYEIEHLVQAIKSAQCHEEYPVEIDIDKFKCEFARVLAMIELGEKEEDTDQTVGSDSSEEENLCIKNSVNRKRVKAVGAICALTGIIAGTICFLHKGRSH